MTGFLLPRLPRRKKRVYVYVPVGDGSNRRKTETDSEEKTALQFCDTLEFLLDLIDRFESLAPKIQRRLEEEYPMVREWDDPGRQDLRMRLQAMIRGPEEQTESLTRHCVRRILN